MPRLMLKYYEICIIISFVAILFSLFVPPIFQDVLGVFGIFSIGILHGANDLLILSKKAPTSSKNHFKKSFLLYIGVVAFGGLLFFYVSQFALLAFVLVSCFHFGEQHWESSLANKSYRGVFYFCYGGLVFFLLFCLKYDEVAAVIHQITSLQLSFNFFQIGLLFFGSTFYTFIILIKELRKRIFFETLLLVLLSILFYYSSLLFGFAFYFVVWHSFPSLRSQLRFLYNDTGTSSFLKYLKASAIYWVMALFGMGIGYFFIDFNADYFLPLFFSFLAAITFPHVVVMLIMFRSVQKEGN